jgi:hypothetical protein
VNPASQTNIDLIKTETDKIPAEIIKTSAIKAKTDNLPVNPASQTNIDLIKTETDKIPAEIIKTSYIQSQVRKTCPKKTTTSLVTQNLFAISGGAVEVIRLIGHITTTTQSNNNNTKIVFTATGRAAVDLCATNNMNNRSVGRVCNISKVKADAMTVSPDDGVVVITTTAQLILVPGIISLNCAGNTSGVIDWEIEYSPLTNSSIVEPI